MKLLFGVKLGRFCLHSTTWIAASRRRECGISVLAMNRHQGSSRDLKNFYASLSDDPNRR